MINNRAIPGHIANFAQIGIYCFDIVCLNSNNFDESRARMSTI